MLTTEQYNALKALLSAMDQAEESGLIDLVSQCDHCAEIVKPFGLWLKETSLLVANDMMNDIDGMIKRIEESGMAVDMSTLKDLMGQLRQETSSQETEADVLGRILGNRGTLQ